MKIISAVVAGLLMGATAATPVLAQAGQACLQHNRMQSWRAMSEYEMDFTDIQRHHYLVSVTPACRGLTDPQAHLIFHTWENLQCLPVGEIIEVTSPVFGRTSCAISGVQQNGPQLPGYGSSG